MIDWRRFVRPTGGLGWPRIIGLASLLGIVAIGVGAPASDGATPAYISFSPALYGYGKTPVGTTASKTVTLTNGGGTSTGPLAISLLGDSTFTVSADHCTGTSLAPAGSCTVTVSYKPTRSGETDLTTLWAHGTKPAVAAAALLSGTGSPAVAPTADLSITKTDSSGGSVVAGGSVTYTIVVANNGPSGVSGASVVDSMPAALSGDTFTAVESGGASGFTSSGIGSIDDTVSMPAGSSITYTVVGQVASSATGTLSNTATVSAPAGVSDPNPANNSATDSEPIVQTADLSITKTDSSGAGSVLPGAQLTYTIVVINNGPSGVSGASVVDSMPAALSGDTFTAVESGGASGFTSSGIGSIDDTVSMPAGSSITYTVKATVSSAATPSLTLSNTATASVPEGVVDPDPSNNSATATNPIGSATTCTTNCALTSGSPSTGTVNVAATGAPGTTGTVQAAVFTGPLACTYTGHQLNLDPNTYEVIASSSAFSKTVSIEFPAPSNAPKIDPSFFYVPFEANVLGNVQICFQATYPFAVQGGGDAPLNPTTGLYTGLLPDCPYQLAQAKGPCDERWESTLTNVGAPGTTNYDINETAFIPSGESGDPRMN